MLPTICGDVDTETVAGACAGREVQVEGVGATGDGVRTVVLVRTLPTIWTGLKPAPTGRLIQVVVGRALLEALDSLCERVLLAGEREARLLGSGLPAPLPVRATGWLEPIE